MGGYIITPLSLNLATNNSSSSSSGHCMVLFCQTFRPNTLGTPLPPSCESNAPVRPTAGVVSANSGPLYAQHSVQDLNRLFCFCKFWNHGIWQFLFLVVYEDQVVSVI